MTCCSRCGIRSIFSIYFCFCGKWFCGRCRDVYLHPCDSNSSCSHQVCSDCFLDCSVCRRRCCFHCVQHSIDMVGLDKIGWCPDCSETSCFLCKKPTGRKSLIVNLCRACHRNFIRLRTAFDETRPQLRVPIGEFTRLDGDRRVRYRVMNFLLGIKI